ncbi:major facilitator superfamily domain-containing protein [Mucidula mucida]|nr:major facilitator superfamily domain-containing protein [Mucidula mucida]
MQVCDPADVPAEALLAPVPTTPHFDEKSHDKEQGPATDQDHHAPPDWTFPDGGFRAWSIVFGCFLFACTCMGFGLVWGALQDYYHSHMFPETSLSIISLAGGLQNFVMGITAYLAGGIGDRYGYKKMIALSCFLAYLSLLASAFATKLYHIFLFQGFFLGFSQGLGMPLYMSIPSQWFLHRRGFATGIAVSGSGFGAAIGCLIVRQLLTKVGFRNAMLVYSSMHAFIWIVALFLIKERRRPQSVGAPRRPQRWLPERINGQFYSVAASIFLALFGYLSPFYYSSTFVKQYVPSLDQDSLLVVGPLVVMNFCAGIGRISAGTLADTFGPINVFFSSFFFGGLFQIVIWPFCKSYASIMVYSVLNGLVGCWFISLIPVVCANLFGLDNLSTITGFMILMNAPGQLAGGSISGVILNSSGRKWWAMTLYSGGMMIVGALFVLYARFSKDRRIWARV